MFCSTIIATVGRDKLDRAVQSMLGQEFARDEFEIIVVNDSGAPLADYAWQQSDQVTIINTQKRERCFARNSGAAIAKGRYLHFLDDDDWMEPGFLSAFYSVCSDNENHVFYFGSTQLLNRDGSSLIQLRHNMQGNCFAQVMSGEWLPLQSSLIRAEVFFRIGGFNLLNAGGEDVDLLRQLAFAGDFVEVPAIGCNLEMGIAQSTTDYEGVIGLSRSHRELLLDEPKAFERLKGSAPDAKWQGRIFRIYLTSMMWNLQAGRLSVAFGRAVYAFRACLSSFPKMFRAQYWRAVSMSYESQTFLNGFELADMPVQRR